MTKYKITALLICLIMLAAMLPTAADSAFSLKMSAPEGASVGSTVYLTLEINALPKSISGFQCELSFDTSILEPVITTSGTNMDSFMTTNTKSFEQICEYRGNGVYFLAFCTRVDGKSETAITDPSDLVVKIPFKIISEGICVFKIAQSSVLAFDTDLKPIIAEGSEYKFAALAKQSEFFTTIECVEALSGTSTAMTLTITNKTAADGIAAFELLLEYSASSLQATLTDNTDDAMDAFIVSAPTGWQQLCRHEADGRYRIRLVAPNGGTASADCLPIGQSIVMQIPFKVIGNAEASASFSVPYAECTAYAADLRLLTGVGASKSLTVGKTPEFTFKDSKTALKGGFIIGIPADTAAKSISDYMGGEIHITSGGSRIGDDALVATGMIAELWYNGQLITSATVIVKGDVNCDGRITVADAIMIQRAYLGTQTLEQNALLASQILSTSGAQPADYFAVKRHIQKTYNIR